MVLQEGGQGRSCDTQDLGPAALQGERDFQVKQAHELDFRAEVIGRTSR